MLSHNTLRSLAGKPYLPELRGKRIFREIPIRNHKVWALPVSLATTPRIVIYSLFLCLLRCFSSAGSLSLCLWIQHTMLATLLAAGFPIRIFRDIVPVGGSPGLFAVFHVLLRWYMSRHPFCALEYLLFALTELIIGYSTRSATKIASRKYSIPSILSLHINFDYRTVSPIHQNLILINYHSVTAKPKFSFPSLNILMSIIILRLNINC